MGAEGVSRRKSAVNLSGKRTVKFYISEGLCMGTQSFVLGINAVYALFYCEAFVRGILYPTVFFLFFLLSGKLCFLITAYGSMTESFLSGRAKRPGFSSLWGGNLFRRDA